MQQIAEGYVAGMNLEICDGTVVLTRREESAGSVYDETDSGHKFEAVALSHRPWDLQALTEPQQLPFEGLTSDGQALTNGVDSREICKHGDEINKKYIRTTPKGGCAQIFDHPWARKSWSSLELSTHGMEKRRCELLLYSILYTFS